MAEFTIAGPKDSCADLDCIKTVGCVPIGYSRIAAHARTHTNVKNASGVSNFAQTPDGQRRNPMIIDAPSQSVRSSIQLAEPEPIRVSVASLRNMSGERKYHAITFNPARRIAEASAARRSCRCRRNNLCWLLLGWLVARQHRCQDGKRAV